MADSQLPPSLRLKQSEIAYPCGLIALYNFDDKFEGILSNVSNVISVYTIHDNGISFVQDREEKFKVNADVNSRGGYWINPISEHLMVWY
jgi:hypothetical protein